MEEGIYEITVTLGVDMSATYNVTVSGSAETDSLSLIHISHQTKHAKRRAR